MAISLKLYFVDNYLMLNTPVHPVLKETCTTFMYLYLLGARCYYVNRQIWCTGAIACVNSGESVTISWRKRQILTFWVLKCR